jgi:hypothetical protein
VINPKACIAGVGVPEIVLESVNPFPWMEFAQCVGPTLGDQMPKGFPHLWTKKRIVKPALGFVNVSSSVGMTL